MSKHYGYRAAGSTLYVFFESFDSNGASVTLTGLAVAGIEIYKDGSPTQRASDNGVALLDFDGIDFDGKVGIHGFSIDLSDDSDAGFYVSGSSYAAVVEGLTIDVQSVRFVVEWDIGPAPANVQQWLGTAVPTPVNAGFPEVSASYWGLGGGFNVPLATSQGVPSVHLSDSIEHGGAAASFRLASSWFTKFDANTDVFNLGKIDNVGMFSSERQAIADTVMTRIVEGTTTVVEWMRLVASACYNKVAGAGTNTVTLRDEADSKDRITATVDADGNRTAVTLDKTP